MKAIRVIFASCLLAAALHPAGARADMANWVDKQNPVILDAAGIVNYGGTLYTLDAVTRYVDRQLSDAEAALSPFVYNDIRQALAALRTDSAGRVVTLLIAPGVYWLDDPDDTAIRGGEAGGRRIPYAAEVHCDNLRLVGLNPKPENVVLAVNRGQTQGALGNYTMLHYVGNGLTVENLTLGNYCNVDLDYPLKPEWSRQRRATAIVQAQVAICDNSDRVYARRCRFISRLNLCPLAGARRTLFEDCYFECTDDALAGSAVYLGCRFSFYSGRPFYSTAETGAVLLDCDINIHTRGTQYLTKAAGMVTMIDCRMTTAYDVATEGALAVRWYRDEAPVVCYHSNVTLNGAPLVIEGADAATSVDLTGRPLLEAYKVTTDGRVLYNTPNLLAGHDDWDPLDMGAAIDSAGTRVGRDLRHVPVLMSVAPSRGDVEAEGGALPLGVAFSRWGGYGVPQMVSKFIYTGAIQWQGPNTVRLRPDGDRRAVCSGRNPFDTPAEALVTATADFGWRGASAVRVAPKLVAAPTFTRQPALKTDKKQKGLVLSYTLTAGTEERSHVTWYRLTDPHLMDTIAVRHGTTGDDKLTYTLSRADVGCYIMATVTPRYKNSHAGTTATVMTDEPMGNKRIAWKLFDEKEMTTDFQEIPVRYQPAVRPGYWTFDAYKPSDTQDYEWPDLPDPEHAWYYGSAVDGAVGLGLVQQTRGARMFYTPVRDRCGDMTVTLIVDPCKAAGQGFGSATGQYMDVYIKFDAKTLTGYALRIERTPDYDKAVTFTLMRYDHGKTTPISAPLPSACYRTSCTIRLALNGHTLTATASTTATLRNIPEGVSPDVSLSAEVEGNDFTSTGIQHTGSVGASATMIHYMSATWGL